MKKINLEEIKKNLNYYYSKNKTKHTTYNVFKFSFSNLLTFSPKKFAQHKHTVYKNII